VSGPFKILPELLFVLTGLVAVPAYADCTGPAGKAADIIYNVDYHTYQFCNGTIWIQYRNGTAWRSQNNYNPTIPAGSGFFVLSHDTYDGGRGGRAAADATCLTDLTTNTGWRGYAAANSAGQLVAGKVHAFLCDQDACTNLMPLATYYFANAMAGQGSAGGASFTTDSGGVGPNDSANWAAANYFSGTYTYWTGNAGNTATAWDTAHSVDGQHACGIFGGRWNSNSSGDNGEVGQSTSANGVRWTASTQNCANTFNLICVVNP